MEIYSVKGGLVATLPGIPGANGTHEVLWNCKDGLWPKRIGRRVLLQVDYRRRFAQRAADRRGKTGCGLFQGLVRSFLKKNEKRKGPFASKSEEPFSEFAEDGYPSPKPLRATVFKTVGLPLS